jgi:hypothetical protein
VGSQQPPLQAVSLAPPHAAPHVCVDVLHAWPAAQSDAALQPQTRVPGMQWGPAGFPVQSTQAPVPPHTVSLVPGRHVEPVPQQPELHGAPVEHAKVHSPVATLHPALVEGQSPATPHPHWPPPATGSQTLPLAPAAKPAVHEAHKPPLLPHAMVAVPAWHVPPEAAEQQPSWQGCAVLQVVVHACVVVSHA